MDINAVKEYLLNYDGPDINIMEVCGSHTAAIAKFGIPSIISKKIHLLSGPGCPVCVTPSSYVDKLIEFAREGKTIVTFGDLIRVPGSHECLADIKGEGCKVEMAYSPFDVIKMARECPDTQFVFAAVGFETTTPVYALLLDEIINKNIKNVKLLTAIKTMPAVIDHMLSGGAKIDAFLAPGHVSVVTGYGVFEPISKKYRVPFGVAGFAGEELLVALYGLMKQIGEGSVKNYYPAVVTREGNTEAKSVIEKYFAVSDASWRGLGSVPGSGLLIRSEYGQYDAGSSGLDADEKINPACSCDRVLMGHISPTKCPLFGKICTPMNPQGACMVSDEGACRSYYLNKRK